MLRAVRLQRVFISIFLLLYLMKGIFSRVFFNFIHDET